MVVINYSIQKDNVNLSLYSVKYLVTEICQHEIKMSCLGHRRTAFTSRTKVNPNTHVMVQTYMRIYMYVFQYMTMKEKIGGY